MGIGGNGKSLRKYLLTVLFGMSALFASAQLNTDRLMAIGRNALYFDDYILSIQYFNQVIKVKPYLADPYLFRAIAKLSLEDYQGAEDDCTEALQRNPFMVRAYYCRSYARMNLKDYRGSIEDCQKGLEFDTENSSLMLNKAISRLYAEQYDSARIDLDNLIDRFPRNMYAYMSRGQLCIAVDDTLGAIDDFSRAISVDRYYAPAYAARAYVSLLRESYTDAIPDLNEAIRLEPDNEGYYINRGLARYYTHDYRGVLSDFDRVLQLNPNSVETYYNRGLIRAEVGDDNRAIEDFDKVIYLDPDNDMAIYNRALLRENTGDLAGAEEDLNVIIDRYPQFIPAYYQRSELRRKRGDAKGADKDYFDAWDLENKLREDRAAGRRFSARGDRQEDGKDDNGKVRHADETDISKYNRVIVAESDASQTARYANPIRGNVQNFNVDIQSEPMFVLTFYETENYVERRRAMNMEAYLQPLTEHSAENLLVTNAPKALDTPQANRHFASVDRHSKQIAEDGRNARLYFARAIDFSLIKDVDNAIKDLDRALTLDEGFVLAYFERANLRFSRMMFEMSENQDSGQDEMTPSDQSFSSDYLLVMQDYDRLLDVDPAFVYAWYNRGYIHCMQKDYRSALEDYDKAIGISPEFAEAWFNRGLTHIYLGQREQGLRDLSRAGELGIYKAYNIIKRFSDNN